jgi:cell division transport system ATP-binding protein
LLNKIKFFKKIRFQAIFRKLPYIYSFKSLIFYTINLMLTGNSIVLLQDVGIYQEQQLILEQVNMHLQSGEFVYLIGRTGTGKSSLLKTIYGDLPFQKGRGVVAGFDLAKLNRKTIPLLRRRLGIIFQDFNLLSDRSIEDNLLFALRAMGWNNKRAMADRISEVLESVGLTGTSHKMPYTMSGGEQQRIVIARALLNHPELIIADEPTGNLDPETSDDLVKLFRSLSKKHNTAVIFATHDYRILESFPARIIRCYNGRLVEEDNIVV